MKRERASVEGSTGGLVYPLCSLTAHTRGWEGWPITLLCSRTAHTPEWDTYGFYPVARNNIRGSGSNKFCLAALAWEEGASLRDRGWVGEKIARNWRAIGPPFREEMAASLVGPLVVLGRCVQEGIEPDHPLRRDTSKL